MDISLIQEWSKEPAFWLGLAAVLLVWRSLRQPNITLHISPPTPPADQPRPGTMERIAEASKVAQQVLSGAQKIWEWRWLILHRIGYRLVVHGQHSRYQLYHKAALKLIGEQTTRVVSEEDVFTTDEQGKDQHSHVEWKSIIHSQWVRFEDVWVHLDYTPAQGPSKDDPKKIVQREELRFYFLTNQRAILQRFRNFSDTLLKEDPNKTLTVYCPQWSSWYAATKRKLRPGDSLFFNDDMHLNILEDYHQFMNRRDDYHARGRLHKRGYLLRGAPGGGKTNLALWFAGQVGMNLAVLSTRGLDDECFTNLTLNMPSKTILLLEDIDTVAPGPRDNAQNDGNNAQNDDSSLSLGALLNTLDGLLSREGQIVFMTTNHPEKLDPALIRPGRADVVRTIEAPSAPTTINMAQSWYGETPLLTPLSQALQQLDPIPSAAELEAHFDRCPTPEEALNTVQDIIKAR